MSKALNKYDLRLFDSVILSESLKTNRVTRELFDARRDLGNRTKDLQDTLALLVFKTARFLRKDMRVLIKRLYEAYDERPRTPFAFVRGQQAETKMRQLLKTQKLVADCLGIRLRPNPLDESTHLLGST
jgi:hypothetical protein